MEKWSIEKEFNFPLEKNEKKSPRCLQMKNSLDAKVLTADIAHKIVHLHQ